MLYDHPAWKEDWVQTQEHYLKWWRQEGPILTFFDLPRRDNPRGNFPAPPKPNSPRQRHVDPDWFAANQRYLLACEPLPADNLPIAHTDYGCVQMATYFGSEPSFSEDTVWYSHCITDPDDVSALSLTQKEPWYLSYKQIMQQVYDVSEGDYLVGMPAFGSNLDVLAELRGTQDLLYDLLDRADWVKERLEEVNQAFFSVFDDYYSRIRLADGSSAYTHFHIWGPGKVSQVQCDFSAMISPDMFEEFAVAPLQRQCAWLDHALYHLDGRSCIRHLDLLLAIPELDAVQWTPGAGEPGAGSDIWYSLYERILGAGKSAQILGVTVEEAKRILNTFGSKGVYLAVQAHSEAEVDEMITLVDSLR